MSQKLAVLTDEHRLNLYAPVARFFSAELDGDIEGAAAAFESLRSARQGLGASFYCSVLSDLELNAGNMGAALEHADRGIAHAESSGERFWFPRLLCQRALIAHRLGQSRQTTEAALDTSVQEARRRGMLMYELEATLARSTLTSHEPTRAWDGVGLVQSREQVVTALERITASC